MVFFPTLVPLSSCTLNHNTLFFEIPWSHHIRSSDTPPWTCVWFFLLCLLHSSISFVPFIEHFLCNPWLSCFPVYFPTHITQYLARISWYSTAFLKFSLLHSFTPGFCSRVSCASCHLAYNVSRSHLGFRSQLMPIFTTKVVVISISVCFRHCLYMLLTVFELMLTRT